MGKLVVLICIIISIIPFSQGLNCFHCVYKDFPGDIGIPGHPQNDKCEKKVPDDFVKGCTYPSQVPPGILTGGKNTSISSTTINAETDTCAKFHVKLPNSELILRTCIPKTWVTEIDESKLGKCTSGNLKQLADQYNITLDGIDASSYHIEAACFCDGNSCNSAIRGTTGGILALFIVLAVLFLN